MEANTNKTNINLISNEKNLSQQEKDIIVGTILGACHY